MKGFSLIELLTVVIIVGILSAIALPQYTKAVEKSRATEAVTLGKAIVDAQNRSLDAFPNDPVNVESALDIALPQEGAWLDKQTYVTSNFKYTLEDDGVRITRNGNAFTLFMGNNDATADNWCDGSICGAMGSMGFKLKSQDSSNAEVKEHIINKG